MRLDKFDLNLLIALELLLEEQNVTRAAQRLNLTQSAMSAALARLRLALNDDLLVPHGRRMVATPHALALGPMVSEAISTLRVLISGATAFDPATSDRRFDIAASDYIATVLLSPLLPQLKHEAPHVEINMMLPTHDTETLLEDGKLDFQLTPEQFLSQEHPSELLFEERHVVVGCASNTVFRGEMTDDAFHSCGHVAVRIGGVPTFVERHMRQHEDRRRIEVTSPSFSLVPWLLPGTRLLALMHERLARAYAPLLGLEIRDAPFAMPIMREMIQYHTARATDAGMIWFRQRLLTAARAY
ncbi:LysR family transcriptional regulator (plasmid) [Novosphingobium resinovorum]|uniref:LysR family transcriptional regulator n=1 Tax=Novosphingobium TaxID=165696 RepID=UPI001B3C5FBF|nr:MULTISPECIES: LysR family transcriptional regulator [Novosphingobium]MBF7015312.1 LysR family transcriptional regulator [Novosphingobium sp. HR1a]WJM29991.1 LysR family transcriptional regulator [Novosphingobium resinovorum]